MKRLNWNVIMAFTGCLFAYSLLPTVYLSIVSRSINLPWQSLIISTIAMTITELFYAANKMWWAFATCAVTTLSWALLLVLKFVF